MNARLIARLSIVLVCLMPFAGQVWAGSWQQAVSSRVSTEFDTNPAMSPANPGSVWRYLFEPSYNFMGRAGANELKAGLVLQIARSSNQTLSQNLDGPSLFFDWSRPSEAGEFGISSKYAEIATRDAGVDATGLVPVNSTRISRTLSGRWTKALSERSKFSADGAYESASYKGGTFVGYISRSGGAIYNYAWSEQSTYLIRMSYVENRAVGVNSFSRNANAFLGWNWKPSDYLEFTLQGGVFKVTGPTTGSQGTAMVKYTGQRTELALNAGRQVSASGLGGFVKADQIKGSWSYALSESSNTGVDMERRKNSSITINDNRTSAGVWLQRNLNPSWVTRTNYQHNNFKGGGVGVSSNILGISFVYTNSDF